MLLLHANGWSSLLDALYLQCQQKILYNTLVFLFSFSDVVCWPSVGPQDTIVSSGCVAVVK